MSSPVIIKVKCPVHLIKFYETICGGQPIVFDSKIKRYFNRFLNHYLEIPPLGYQEYEDAEDVMKIQLPYFKDKDVRSYTYLPVKREKLFIRILDNYFKLSFYNEAFQLVEFFSGERKQKKQIMDNFIDTYNLPVDCIDLLQRDYSRMLNTRRQRKFFRTNKNTSLSASENEPLNAYNISNATDINNASNVSNA
ncbi:MAG: hypothetical protein ACOYM0_01105 [Bacteroidales bacterium]